MKTKVKIIGSLFVQHNEYLLVRIETAQGLPTNATLFTVLTDYTVAPKMITVASTAWTIEYADDPYDAIVETSGAEEVDYFVDYSQIPEPEMTEQEWEFLLNNLENTNKEN